MHYTLEMGRERMKKVQERRDVMDTILQQKLAILSDVSASPNFIRKDIT